MAGRSRGPGTRARPRIVTPGEDLATEEETLAGELSRTCSTTSLREESVRGRGGLRSQLITKPPNILNTIGTEGPEIKILANYFRIKVPDDEVIYDYHLDFEPQVESTYERKRLLLQVCNVFGEAYLFDGMSNLKSLMEIDSPSYLDAQRANGEEIVIMIRKVGTIAFGCFEMLRMYNVQMRRNLAHLGLMTIGRYYYEKDPVKIFPDHHGVGVHSGYLTAVNIHDGGLMTVVDTIFKFIFQESIYMYLKRMCDSSNLKWRQDARKEVSGKIVLCKHNDKTYKVTDIDFNHAPSDSFLKKDGTSITYINYYASQYNYDIGDHRQPLLVAQATDKDRRTNEFPPPVYLVPEMCILTGLTDKMRADHAFMRKVATVTKLKPQERVSQMAKFINDVKAHSTIQKEMSQWRMEMDNHLVPVKGRFLQRENLLMGKQSKSVINFGDFTKDLRGKTMFKTVHLQRWALVYPHQGTDDVKPFLDTLYKVGEAMGIAFANPKIIALENDKVASFIPKLEKIPPEAQMIVCLVGSDKKDRYDAIKQFLCITHPIPSQVITARVIRDKARLMSVATKIAIQIAAKTGAEPWALEIPPKNVMVIGFDTYHDSLHQGRSAGAFVSTTNQTLTQYYSRVVFHNDRAEMSNSMLLSTYRAVQVYMESNGDPPDRIIFYRDGVSEGMVQHVYEIEVPLVKKGILEATEGKAIPLTFIIVTKRLNTRFYAVKDGKYLNPPCGTVVDTQVTRASRYDFFLVSQTVSEGTVSPTMFDIICDESGWSPTNHQKFAYKLTHLYYNWSGTVKVPAPCQYAHKLAFLSGQSLHAPPHARLERTLHFL